MATSDQILKALQDNNINYDTYPGANDPDQNKPNFHLELLMVLHDIRIELKNANNLNAKINNIQIRNNE